MTTIVTGAANGLGRSLALALSARGDDVLAVDCDPTALSQLEGVRRCVLDLLDDDPAGRLLSALDEPCDAVFHVAGISGTGRFEEIPADHHERIVRLNFEVPMQITCALLAAAVCAPRTQHVFIGSVASCTGYPGATSYAASKAGLASFARSLDAAPENDMSAHCVFPGPLRTAHAARYAPDNSAATIRRRQHPDDAAAVILRRLEQGRHRIYPSRAARSLATLGRVMPAMTGRALRRSIYDRLTTPQL